MECLNVFTLFYAASFLIKRVFMKLAMFFTSSARRIFIKLLSVSESSEKLKVSTFLNFAFSKTFAYKRVCVITSKLQML